ncbi:MAG: hypothetical protein WBS18_12935 [Candidatus Acidiferrales bacterium]
MFQRTTFRRFLVPVTLVALLLLTVVFGGLWHHHSTSSEATCSICHFVHQPMDQPLAGVRAPALAPLGVRIEPGEIVVAPLIEARRVPARAPPIV